MLLKTLTEMAAAQICGNCHQPMGGNHFYRKVGGQNKRFCKGSAIKKAIAAGYSPQGNISFLPGDPDPNVAGGSKGASPKGTPPRGTSPTGAPLAGGPTGPTGVTPQTTRAPTKRPATPASASTTITKPQLESWLKDIGIKPDQYEVVNGRLNIKTSVHMTDQEYTQLPVPFGNIRGDFEIVMPTLKTFKNFPKEIDGNLTIFHTDVQSSDELDVKVAGGVYMSKNKNLTDFRKIHKRIKSVDSGITVDLDENTKGGLGFLLIPGIQYLHIPSNSKVEEILNKYFKEDADLLDIQEDLIEAGFKNLARI